MKFEIIEKTLNKQQQVFLAQVYQRVYDENMPDSLLQHINKQVNILLILAFDGSTPVGFKLGCINLNGRFYSWLGGVDSAFRRQGIARKLMQAQFKQCISRGYKSIEMQVAGDNTGMLLLSVSEGFFIIGGSQSSNGEFITSMKKILT